MEVLHQCDLVCVRACVRACVPASACLRACLSACLFVRRARVCTSVSTFGLFVCLSVRQSLRISVFIISSRSTPASERWQSKQFLSLCFVVVLCSVFVCLLIFLLLVVLFCFVVAGYFKWPVHDQLLVRR